MIESVSTRALELVVQVFSKQQKFLPIIFRMALGSVAASKVERVILNRSNTGLEKENKSVLTGLGLGNLMLWRTLSQRGIPCRGKWGIEIFLHVVAPCFRNRDNLRALASRSNLTVCIKTINDLSSSCQ